MNNDMLEVGAPLPVSIGRCADLYHDVRELRLAMEKEVEKVKARETEVWTHIVDNLSKSNDTGAAGLRYRAQVIPKRKPRLATGDVPGWGPFTSWVRKHDRFDMLQRRINEKAIGEFQEAENRLVPGIEMVNILDLSVVKL